MSDKKNIDRLFQEKFKDFEVKPNTNVWAGIQSKMEQPQEKTRTGLPIWLRFAGIAAALVLLFTVGNLVFNNENTENTTTVADTKNDIESTNSNSNSTTEKIIINSTVSAETINTLKGNKNGLNSEKEAINNKEIVTIDNDSRSNKASEAIKNKPNNLSSQSPYVNDAPKEKTDQYLTNQNNNSNRNNINSNSNGVTLNSEKESVLNASNNSQKYAQSNTVKKRNDAVSNSNYSNNTVTNNDDTPTNTIIPNRTSITTDQKESNTKAADALDNNSATSNTAVAITNSEKEKEEENQMEPDSANSSNAIEEALAKNEDLDEKEEENVNRWSVNANAAPVYYNTLSKGSHIHDQFIDNPKNGEINTSYGINVGYAINDKLKVRSGINKLNLSYDTANVIVYENVTSTPSSSPLRNIDFIPTSQGQNISVLSANSLSVQQISSVINDDLNAALSQRLSYVEIPLELEYAVVKQRFGLNLIGGFSTFLLNNNEVVAEVDNRKTKIGEANNINNVSFSANAGIGIDYKFSDAIKFNIEPTFKYQINAYSETSGNFKPYIIGVYTGISYKF